MINARAVPGWLDVLAWVSIALGIVSAVVIAFDILSGRKQKMAIMNLVGRSQGCTSDRSRCWRIGDSAEQARTRAATVRSRSGRPHLSGTVTAALVVRWAISRGNGWSS